MFFLGFGSRGDRTGADGSFELRSAPGRFTVSAALENYGKTTSEELDLGVGASMDDLVLRLGLQAEEPEDAPLGSR